MTELDFVYWLQGYLEVSGAKEISPEQVQIIRDHIKLVMVKVTPKYSLSSPGVAPTSPFLIDPSKLIITC